MRCHEPQVVQSSRYSMEEAAELLAVHRNTLLRYAKEGKIRFGIRRGTKRKFFLGSEIIRFWKAQL